MRNLKRPLIASVLAAVFGASIVLACGGDFSWQPFDDRAVTLDTMPVNTRSFAYAEAHLFPSPNDKLIPEETGYPAEARNDDIAEAVAHAEVAGLATDQAGVVQQMRAETSGDSAFNKGAMLPAAVRLYTAGAVDFHKGDSAKAIARFQAILDLPANERRDREVWAAFMLGRLYGNKNDIAEASKSFAATREFANNGAPDPLGLGVASFGEEARLHLKRAEVLQKAKKMSPQQLPEYGREITVAIRLYAEQAAHGSKIGTDSLRRVVDDVIDEVAAVAASICDPMVQQLLVARSLDGDASSPTNEDSSSTSQITSTSQISTLVTSVQKCGSGNLIAADRLAAIAYRDGDYPLAHTLAIQATTPLAMWVQARLAMQTGDVAEAAKYYAAASKAFPSSGDTNASDEGPKALLVLENGDLTLSRGEYVDALEQLYPYAATFWEDVTHIAERVLTVDELKTFVDTHKDTQVQPAVSLANLPSPFGNEVTLYDPVEAQTQYWFPDGRGAADHLRDLLARRLVREGRYQEALEYVPPVPPPTPWGSSPPKFIPPKMVPEFLRGEIGPNGLQRGQTAPENLTPDYVQALEHAKHDKSNVDRARGWYRAATLAGDFKSGNKIMGTEGPPDNYAEPAVPYGADGPTELHPDDPFVTEGERQRFKASPPKPNFRYHYLFVGVDEALHAADLLPPRSQAFAAVLCHATAWMIDFDNCPASAVDLRASPTAYASKTPSIADPLTADVLWADGDTARINLTCQLYQRYLKAGAVVPWATKFGHDCPEPDFDSAIQFVQTQTIREARRHRQIVHHRWIVLVKLALVALCLGASTWWFLRHRYV
jgi:cellulose synthase operon protein C